MAIRIKDKKKHSAVFKKMNYYDDMAIKYYEAGNMKKGKYYEDKSDKMYKENYSKIFEVY